MDHVNCRPEQLRGPSLNYLYDFVVYDKDLNNTTKVKILQYYNWYSEII